MYDEADLIGAFRLPNGAHGDAAGTSVLTDVLFFRKRLPGEAPGDRRWLGTSIVGGDDDNKITKNGYYQTNPGQVLGAESIEMGQFGPEMRVKGDGRSLPSAMRQAVARVVSEAKSTDRLAPPAATRTPTSPTR